jgi:hypothetical protein
MTAVESCRTAALGGHGFEAQGIAVSFVLKFQPKAFMKLLARKLRFMIDYAARTRASPVEGASMVLALASPTVATQVAPIETTIAAAVLMILQAFF